MKLMYITPQLSNFGGIERTITDKANYLTENGHHVAIITYEQLDRPYAYNLNPEVKHIDLASSFNLLYRYPICKRILRYVLLILSVRKGLKEAIKSFNPDLIVITAPDTEHYLRTIFSVSKGIKKVIESHNTFDKHFIANGLWSKCSYFLQSPKSLYRKVDLMIILTNGDAQYWRKVTSHIHVIPNPLTSFPSSLTPNSSPLHSHRIIAVGRITPQKRMDRLVDAFALFADKYPQWSVDIFGEGECHQSLQQQIDGLKLSERIHILPPTRQIFEEYQSSSFFVLSSDYEGFGLVIIEAMFCGLPVVSTDCSFGPSEIIEDGKTGLLAKMDVADLAIKMEWMITHKAERGQMGLNARIAAANYSQEVVMPRWEEAYLSVIGNNATS